VQKTFQVPVTPIEQFTLENGLRVVLNEDHSVPVVSITRDSGLTSMIRARRVPRWVPFRWFWTSYLSRKASRSWQYNTPSEDRAATAGDPSSETMARAAVGSETL